MLDLNNLPSSESLAIGNSFASLADKNMLFNEPVAQQGHFKSSDTTYIKSQEEALCGLLHELAIANYRFITITPATHRRVLANRGKQIGVTLQDIFGWNLPFLKTALDPVLLTYMQHADVLIASGAGYRSALRISSIDDDLFLHSAYPTQQSDAVFFGPDTYRFSRFIRNALAGFAKTHSGTRYDRHTLHTDSPLRVLDVGCGTGAGGIALTRELQHQYAAQSVTQSDGEAIQLFMNDINPLALQLTSINAAQAGISVELAQGDALSAVGGQFDLIICNPPYVADPAQRAYRDGGAHLGLALSLRIATEAVKRLAPGGQLLLYTGVAMVDGQDPFAEAIKDITNLSDYDCSYSEIDPDVFGEELDQAAYVAVDRIAAVGLVVTYRGTRA
jgi:methylase of polypeptide subunit release factors